MSLLALLLTESLNFLIIYPYFLIKIQRITIMADKSDKSEKNVPGKFYVDRQCIDCGLCQETASQVFSRDEDAGCAYVSHQPADDSELNAAKEAMDSCPVQAIGDDGE